MREKRLFSRPTIYERKNVTRPQTFQEYAVKNKHKKIKRTIPCGLRWSEIKKKRLLSGPTIHKRKNVTQPQTFKEDAQTNEHQKQRNIPCDLRQTEKKKNVYSRVRKYKQR